MKAKHLVIVGITEAVSTISDAAEERGVVFTAFSNGQKAMTAIPNIEDPDLFIVMAVFPYGHAFELAPIIRRYHPQAKIWLLTAHRAEDMPDEFRYDPNFDRMIMWPGPIDQLLADVVAL